MNVLREHSDIETTFPEYFTCNKEKDFVVSKYTHFQQASVDSIVAFSFVTDAIIILNKQEYKQVRTMTFSDASLFDAMHRNGFFVKKETDEYSLIAQYRHKISARIPKTVKFVILPTTNCNAQCKYCIGMNNRQLTMTAATIEKTIEYIVTVAANYENIKFDWYGGEPLLGHATITHICEEIKCRLPNIKFSSVITTNIACFNDNLLQTAIDSWHIRKVNITIDGIEEEHNSRKKYVNHTLNGYKHTIEYIGKLIEQNISVFCRFNIDKNNVNQLAAVINDIRPFLKSQSFYFFVSPLRGDNTHIEFYKTKEYNALFYDTGVVLNENGVHNIIDSFVPKALQGFCLAKSEHSFVIGPNGNLFRCNLDDLIDDNSTGSVYSGLNKNDVYQQFVGLKLDKKCVDCKFLPICHGGCPIEAKFASDSNCQCTKFRFKLDATAKLLARYYTNDI